MDASIKPYPHYERLVKHLAFKVLRRLHAAGCHSLDVADIEQEMAVTWVLCRERYDASKTTASFVTYFQSAALQNINRWATTGELRQSQMVGASLDAPLGNTGDDVELHEVIPDRADSVELEMIRKANVQAVMKRLDPVAQKFVECLMSPPPELVDGLRAVQARSQFGRERGIGGCAPTYITADLIANAMGLNAFKRGRVYKQIREAVAKVNRGRV